MAIVGASNLTGQLIFQQVIAVLKQHRSALDAVAELHGWAAGISAADLQAAPLNMSAADATALLTAINDAYAEYLTHTTGLPPGSYPQPSSAYVYAASQNAVIGPL